MPPLAAADAFLVLEYLAGNRRVPHPVFSALLAAPPPVTPHNSPRLRKGVALRALDLALSDSDAEASVLFLSARAVLAEPDLVSCFPDHLALCDDVVVLKRLVDAEWASLPASSLEAAADQIVGAGAPHTWANADQDTRRKLHLLVGESMEREILGKLGQDRSTDPQDDEVANAPSTSGANEADRAQQDDEAHLDRGNGNADHVQEDCAHRPQEPVEKTTDARLPKKPVTSASIKGKGIATSSHVTEQIAADNNKSHPVKGSKPSLMERNPTACAYEWDDSGDSEHERPQRKRQLPTYEREPRPLGPRPPFLNRTRKRWTEIEEKTLIEGVEKYGKGNWMQIKIAYPTVFAERSTVDLKDKFRNMERYH
uniref:Uncharacterized protein n=1 Tax=Avena sativa TaxID=4498 RepID=A0ACD5Z3S5_AVESA